MDFAPPFQATGLSHQRPTLTGRLIHFFVITDIGTRPRPRGLPRSRLGSRSIDAPDASVAGEGCDLGDPERVHELPKTRISGAVQPELHPPGGGDYRCVLAGVRADDDVVLLAVGAQLIYLPGRQVRAVGDPGHPVVQAVDGEPVLYGLPVETAVLPDGGVVAAGRRLAVVPDGPLDGPVGRGRVDLYPLGWVLGQRMGPVRPLPVSRDHVRYLLLAHLGPRELGLLRVSLFRGGRLSAGAPTGYGVRLFVGAAPQSGALFGAPTRRVSARRPPITAPRPSTAGHTSERDDAYEDDGGSLRAAQVRIELRCQVLDCQYLDLPAFSLRTYLRARRYYGCERVSGERGHTAARNILQLFQIH